MRDNFMQMSSGWCCDYQWECMQSTRKLSSQQETNSKDSKASRDFITVSANALQSEWGKCLAFGKTPALTTASLTFLSFLLLYSDGDDGIEKGWEIGLAACFPQITPISWQRSGTAANAHSNHALLQTQVCESALLLRQMSEHSVSLVLYLAK